MNKDLAVPDAWRSRDPPLEPTAVAATGSVAARLAAHLLLRPVEALARLRGVAAPTLLVLLGALPDLPWVDGVVYLGRDPHAPSLLLPTALQPPVHSSLLERTLLRSMHAGSAPPLAVLFAPPRLVSLTGARPITHARLHAHVIAPHDKVETS